MEERAGKPLFKVLSAVFYGLSSIAVVFVNKILLTNYRQVIRGVKTALRDGTTVSILGFPPS